jgi:hypothetical protein
LEQQSQETLQQAQSDIAGEIKEEEDAIKRVMFGGGVKKEEKSDDKE